MSQDVASITAKLKEVYEPKINKTFNSASFLASKIGSDSAGIQTGESGGKYKVQTLELDPNTSAGSIGELDEFPDAGKKKFERATIGLTTLAATASTTGLAQAQSDSLEKAVEGQVKSLESATQAATRDFNRRCYGDVTGAIVQIQVESGAGPWVLSYTDDQVRRNRWITRGELISLGEPDVTGSTVTTADVYKVTAVDPANKQFTVETYSGSGTPANDDWVFSQRAVDNSLIGLRQALTDVTNDFHGLDPTAYGEDWLPVTSDASAASISVDLLDEFLEEIDVTSGTANLAGKESTLILTSRAQGRNLYAEMADSIRFNDPSMIKPKGVNYGQIVLPSGHTVTIDTEFADQEVSVVNTNDVKLLSAQGDWSILDGSEQRFERKNISEIVLVRYCQFAWTRRNSHGRITNLAA